MSERHNQALTDQLCEKQPQNNLTEKQEKPLPRLGSISDQKRQAAMLRLWTRMRGIFGTSWTREHGDIDGEQVAVWMDGLGGLTLDQMANGIKQAATWQERFPPNLPQFMKLCLTTKREGVKPENKKYLEHREQSHMPPSIAKKYTESSKAGTERDQSFIDDYNKLCRPRWGALPKELEAKYSERT